MPASPRPGPGEGSTEASPAVVPPPRGGLTRVEETSAGGLVVERRDGTARAALIARHDRRGRLVWSLPKGHVEAGETAQDAAVREVEEETGIRGRVLAPLGTIDFWFVAEQRRIHKTVHHFLLEAERGELSDADIEVVEVAWVPLDEVATRLAYADERRLLDRVPDLLAGSDATGTGTDGAADRQ
jgi:ADP-ribose pyrophosphatase YjhB (NUDIX family)